MLEYDRKKAVKMLVILATVPEAQQMDTLALVVKVFIESENIYSELHAVWARVQKAVEAEHG